MPRSASRTAGGPFDGGAYVADATAQRGEAQLQIWTLENTKWDSSEELVHEKARELLDDPRTLVWIDVAGDSESVRRDFEAIVRDCNSLAGIDPSRATKGGENPPKRPPKAKAFRQCVFARAYWLGTRPTDDPQQLVAQEVHLIVGRTFAVTLRYPCRAWDLDQKASTTTRLHTAKDAGLDLADIRRGVKELRDRFGNTNGHEAFGLEVAAVVLDKVIDSVFDALDGLRQVAEKLEEEVLDERWLWERKSKQQEPTLEDRMLGLRRLLRHVRWAFMPADEIAEFRSGPFINGAGGPGIEFSFTDLRREADRTLETVRDVREQLSHTVELGDTMKTDRLNKTMYVLTAVATILLVPTLIAGIYGMNFRHIPELEWRLGYEATLVAMMVLGTGVWLGIRSYLRPKSTRRRRNRTPVR